MMYVRTIPPEQAEGELKDLYAQDVETQGYVANYTRAISLRPQATAAWRQLSRAIRSTMPLRRYELVTVAVALALRSTY